MTAGVPDGGDAPLAGAGTPFPFVQFEFAFPLGPPEGRYLRRDPRSEAPERVIVLRMAGARPRGRLRGRRPRPAQQGETAAVPIVSVTIIRPAPFEREHAAHEWLGRLRRDRAGLEREVGDGVRELNLVLRAYRAAAADPYAPDVAAHAATVVRVGYGSGDAVADGGFAEAYEVPERQRRRRRVEMLAPQERLAAILSGRTPVFAGEELVLRARVDLDADRAREAALQARVALEALLAELPPEAVGELGGARPAVAEAASAALAGALDAAQAQAVADAVGLMERILVRVNKG